MSIINRECKQVAASIIADICLHDPSGSTDPANWLGRSISLDVHHDADGMHWTRCEYEVSAACVALARQLIALS